MKDNRTVEGADIDGNPIKVVVRTPNVNDYKDSQLAYNKAFREALDSGALLRQRLTDYMREQGIWNDEKQKKSDEYVEKIKNYEDRLKLGGIKLSEAKDIALKLKAARTEFQVFLAEKNSLDSSSAEGQADNARFNCLVRLCILDETGKNRIFKDEEDYNNNSAQPWAVQAASELANMLYGLDPNYQFTLEENKFLKEYNFVNDDLELIDDDGHTVDENGRLINEDGRFIAYRTEEGKKNRDPEQMYFVNKDGEEVVAVKNDDGEEDWVRISLMNRKPFLDDDGNPIEVKKPEAEEDLVTEKPTKPARKSKAKSE